MKVVPVLVVLCAAGGGLHAACAPPLAGCLLGVEMCLADYYAKAYGLPPEFVQAIIDVESAWHPYAVSVKGAAGIMQLMPPIAFALGVTNRFLIEENIRAGTTYLAYLNQRFDGDLRLVAAAYYAGEGRIKRMGLRCADPDVYRYVNQVRRFYRSRQASKRGAHPEVPEGGEHP